MRRCSTSTATTGAAVHCPLAVHRPNRSEGEIEGGVWSFSEVSGWLYRLGAVHGGRGPRRRPWRVYGDQFLDYAARVQRLVAAWCLTGSGHVLEASRGAGRVEAQRAGPIWPATPRMPRRCIGAKGGVMARGGARVLSPARRDSRGTGRARRGGLGGSETATTVVATRRHVGARERGRG